MRKRTWMIVPLALAGFLTAMPCAAEPTTYSTEYPDPTVDKVRFGLFGTLLGPTSLLGGGISLQPVKFLETIVWIGYNKAEAEASAGSATASAKIAVTPILARGRLWFQERHSLLLDLGAGVSITSISASGHDNHGDSLKYERKGTPMISTVGLGYGFRTYGGFRLAILAGALIHLNQLGDSTVTTTGSFNETDRADMKKELDDTTDKLAKVRPYFELDLGTMF